MAEAVNDPDPDYPDDDNEHMPEHLSMVGDHISAQFREHPAMHFPPGELSPRSTKTIETVLMLHHYKFAPTSTESGQPYILGSQDIERLRDLFYFAERKGWLEPLKHVEEYNLALIEDTRRALAQMLSSFSADALKELIDTDMETRVKADNAVIDFSKKAEPGVYTARGRFDTYEQAEEADEDDPLPKRAEPDIERPQVVLKQLHDFAINELCQAIVATKEYVDGVTTRPPLLAERPGWSWYDALEKYAPEALVQWRAKP